MNKDKTVIVTVSIEQPYLYEFVTIRSKAWIKKISSSVVVRM
jgi:hypothetical protein